MSTAAQISVAGGGVLLIGLAAWIVAHRVMRTGAAAAETPSDNDARRDAAPDLADIATRLQLAVRALTPEHKIGTYVPNDRERIGYFPVLVFQADTHIRELVTQATTRASNAGLIEVASDIHFGLIEWDTEIEEATRRWKATSEGDRSQASKELPQRIEDVHRQYGNMLNRPIRAARHDQPATPDEP